jgi:hypothetical protein
VKLTDVAFFSETVVKYGLADEEETNSDCQNEGERE